MSDRYTVLVDGVRSPIGIKSGQMIGMRSDDLSSQTIKVFKDQLTKVNSRLCYTYNNLFLETGAYLLLYLLSNKDQTTKVPTQNLSC